MKIRRVLFLAAVSSFTFGISGCSDEETPAVADSSTANATGSGLSPATPPDASGNAGSDHSSDSGHGDSGGGGNEHGGGGANMGAPAGMGMPSPNGLPVGEEGAMTGGMGGSGGGEHNAGSGDEHGDGMMSGGSPGMGAPAGMNGSFGGAAASKNNGRMGAVSSGRPSNPGEWSREDILAGVREKDARVLDAIQAKSRLSNGDPQFAALAEEILGSSSASMAPAGMGMTPPAGITGLPFGGLGSNTTVSQPTGGKPKAGAKPPGGAASEQRQKLIQGSSTIPMDTLEIMLGESVLGFQSFSGGGAAVMSQAGGEMSVGSSTPQASGSSAGFATESDPPGGMSPQPSRGAPGRGAPSNFGNTGSSLGGFGAASTSGTVSVGGLTPEALIRTLITGLVINNTDKGWELIDGIATGRVSTDLPKSKSLQIAIEETLSSESTSPEFIQNLVSLAVTDAIDHSDVEAQQLVTRLNQSVLSQYFGLSGLKNGLGTAQVPGSNSSNTGPENRGAPGIGAPGIGAPGLGAPGIGAPGLGAPGIGAPGLGAPGIGAPGLGAPGVGASSGGGEHVGSGGGEHVNSGGGAASPGGFGSSSGGQFGGQPSGGFPGFSGPPPRAGSKTIKISETSLAAVASALWTPTAAASIAQQIQQSSDLATAGPLIQLAANLPRDEVRRQLFDLISQNYKGGAAALISSGFVNNASDPGTLNILKSLPRLRPPRETPAANSEAALKMTWVDLTKQYVLQLRDRVRNAENSGGFAASGPPKLRLHRGASPQVSLEIALSKEELEALGTSKPSDTKVYYTRSTITPRSAQEQKTIQEHYEKQAKGYVRPYQSEGMLWIDGLRKNANGTLQSMDVLISLNGRPANQFGGGAPGGLEEGGGPGQTGGSSFTLETLVVITKDPSLELGDEVASSN